MSDGPIPISKTGYELLCTPLLNKGTAFTQAERDALGLNGLLPSHISTPDEQIQRTYLNYTKKRTALGKYSFLMNLLNRNEVLFYQFAMKYATQLLPYIYTPTVGEASIQFSQIYSHHRGFYLSYPLRDQMEACFENLGDPEVDVIVATDGERILGLGDQGIGGMTIPVGKLSLYTIFGGIHPGRTLPIVLDVGTNNEEHLKNKLYLGWRHPRISGKEYDEFIEHFVRCVKRKFPKAVLQWEDIGRANARRLLDRYRSQLLSFNDDIQGTAAVVMSGLLAAGKITHQNLSEMRVAILGGGSAGTGIAEMLVQGMVDQGLSLEKARQQIYIVDINGLIHYNSPNLDPSQAPFAQPHANLKGWKVHNFDNISLQEVIANGKPHVLIGVSAQAGAFTKEMIEEMASYEERPIILPLSNPTSKAEAIPQELIEWSRGKAIIATGSPFQPVQHEGKSYTIGQCNNVYIFPGLGLGALAAGATQVTNGMILIAAETLAEHSPALKNPANSLFPSIDEVRAISQTIAIAVAKRAIEDGVSKAPPSEIEKRVKSRIWNPQYSVFISC
jgi:malate dehydrogenase (oxaloacetate-decarboxylating)